MTGILRDSWRLCERLIHRHHVFYNGSSPRRLAGLGITKFYLDRYTFVSASDGRAVVSYRYTASTTVWSVLQILKGICLNLESVRGRDLSYAA